MAFIRLGKSNASSTRARDRKSRALHEDEWHLFYGVWPIDFPQKLYKAFEKSLPLNRSFTSSCFHITGEIVGRLLDIRFNKAAIYMLGQRMYSSSLVHNELDSPIGAFRISGSDYYVEVASDTGKKDVLNIDNGMPPCPIECSYRTAGAPVL